MMAIMAGFFPRHSIDTDIHGIIDEKVMYFMSRYFIMSSLKTPEKTPVCVFSFVRLAWFNEIRLLHVVMGDEDYLSSVGLGEYYL